MTRHFDSRLFVSMVKAAGYNVEPFRLESTGRSIVSVLIGEPVEAVGAAFAIATALPLTNAEREQLPFSTSLAPVIKPISSHKDAPTRILFSYIYWPEDSHDTDSDHTNNNAPDPVAVDQEHV